ncbi:MAG: hypothetical protein M3O67_05825 [Bacteroidota bacterium]|nr:hypothetical protein [Bacteroidota bacterium]
MRTALVLIGAISILASCNTSAVYKKIADSDSLVIEFKDVRSNSIVKTVTTNTKVAINKIIDFVDRQASENYKCGYDGKLIFFSKGQAIQHIDFMKSDVNCRHFSFLLNDKLTSTIMTAEAAAFFDSLEQGRDFY